MHQLKCCYVGFFFFLWEDSVSVHMPVGYPQATGMCNSSLASNKRFNDIRFEARVIINGEKNLHNL